MRGRGVVYIVWTVNVCAWYEHYGPTVNFGVKHHCVQFYGLVATESVDNIKSSRNIILP